MICIPITAATHVGAMRAVERSVAVADVVELRMDLIRDGRVGELIDHVKACREGTKVLVTHRPQNLRDMEQERRRIADLKKAVGLGADFVDVELETDSGLREEIHTTINAFGCRTTLIVSYHDFKSTPPRRTLKTILNGCVTAGADVVKIVTWARHPEDNLRVLGLSADARRQGVSLINFCMGPQGRMSRIAAPILGSCLSYASLRPSEASASGQLTVWEMKRIMNILGRQS